MANLSMKHIYKVYPGGVKAVNDFTMEIEDKEFIVFVGPSGCGKSTTLRMIAGLEDITAGELKIDEDVVNDYLPKDRNIAMVFQNYALYPHMTVFNNIAYSLKIAKYPKEEIKQRVQTAAYILEIEEYLDRKPKALSGGQRQRVALGRAIVREPKVFLLDEPLSNLDAKLRASMRTEISNLHKKLQTTFIYVTHDQIEAMTMGTRIVVMRHGYVQQIDTPRNLFNYPGNKFVAGFIGTPQMNFYDGTVLKTGSSVTFSLDCGVKINMPYSLANRIPIRYMNGNKPVTVGIRPENCTVYNEKKMSLEDFEIVDVYVNLVETLGSETLIYGYFGDGTVQDNESKVTVKTLEDVDIHSGDIIKAAIEKKKVHVFDAITEERIKERVPKNVTFQGTVAGSQLTVVGNAIDLPNAISEYVEDGKVDVIIPTKAVTLGKGNIKAKVVLREDVDDCILYELNVNGNVMFATTDHGVDVDDDTTIDIDLKQIMLDAEAYEIAPLDMDVTFSGSIARDKESKVANQCRFFIEGYSCIAPDFMVRKIYKSKGRAAWTTSLDFKVSIYQVFEAEEGIACKVDTVLDYGKERFVKVIVNAKEYIIPSKDRQVGDEFYVQINFDETQVIDSGLDIILV